MRLFFLYICWENWIEVIFSEVFVGEGVFIFLVEMWIIIVFIERGKNYVYVGVISFLGIYFVEIKRLGNEIMFINVFIVVFLLWR